MLFTMLLYNCMCMVHNDHSDSDCNNIIYIIILFICRPTLNPRDATQMINGVYHALELWLSSSVGHHMSDTLGPFHIALDSEEPGLVAEQAEQKRLSRPTCWSLTTLSQLASTSSVF